MLSQGAFAYGKIQVADVLTVEFLENYRYAQVFAPKGKDFVALEPMTARTSALTTGQGLPLVESGKEFYAAFQQMDPDADHLIQEKGTVRPMCPSPKSGPPGPVSRTTFSCGQ